MPRPAPAATENLSMHPTRGESQQKHQLHNTYRTVDTTHSPTANTMSNNALCAETPSSPDKATFSPECSCGTGNAALSTQPQWTVSQKETRWWKGLLQRDAMAGIGVAAQTIAGTPSGLLSSPLLIYLLPPPLKQLQRTQFHKPITKLLQLKIPFSNTNSEQGYSS